MILRKSFTFSGELNLANVTVWLTNSQGVMAATTTDTNGRWTNSAPPGATFVKVNTGDTNFTNVVPLGWLQTQGTDLTNVTVSAGAEVSGGTNGYYWAAPTIICANNKTVECGIAWSFDAPAFADGTCGTATSGILSTLTNRSGACGNSFIATRTWVAADSCGYSNTCSQVVTVSDTTPPAFTFVPSPVTVECLADLPALVTLIARRRIAAGV